MSVEVLKATPPPRPYRFELLPEDATASALELLEQPVEGSAESGEVADAIERGLRHAMAFAEAQENERRAALILFSQLAHLPVGEMKDRIKSHRPRFRSTELLGLLFDRCADEVHRDPRPAVELGELAVLAAENLDEAFLAGAIWHDVLAESLAVAADTQRHAGDCGGAEATFREAERHLAAGSGTLLVRAELLIKKASLGCDQERYETGLASIRQALAILRAGTEGTAIARALVAKGRLLAESGRPAAALPLYEEALELVEGSYDRALELAADHNLAAALWALGRFAEARPPLARASRSVRLLARPLGRLRVRWLEARLDRGEGDLESAAAGLEEARTGLLGLGRRSAAAQVGVELSELGSAPGRTRVAGRRGARRLLEPLSTLLGPRGGAAKTARVRGVGDPSW